MTSIAPGRGPLGEPVPDQDDDEDAQKQQNETSVDKERYDQTQASLREDRSIVPAQEKPGLVGRVKASLARRREQQAEQAAADARAWSDFKSWRAKFGEKKATDLLISVYGLEQYRRLSPALAKETHVKGHVEATKAQARKAAQSGGKAPNTTSIFRILGPMFGPRVKSPIGKVRLLPSKGGTKLMPRTAPGYIRTPRTVPLFPKRAPRSTSTNLGFRNWRPGIAFGPKKSKRRQ
jgi:hypothetical protein